MSGAIASAPSQFIISAPNVFDMVYDDSTAILYITSNGPNILRYDVKHRTALDPLTVGGNLLGIDISADGSTLAVADNSTADGEVWVDVVTAATGRTTRISGPAGNQESGTYDVAFAKTKIVATGTQQGSGFEAMHLADLKAGTLASFGFVTSLTVLRADVTHGVVSYAQGGGAYEPWGIVDVKTPVLKQVGTLDWPTYDIAPSAGGKRLALPTFKGCFLFRKNGAAAGTISLSYYGYDGAVFDPTDSNRLYLTEGGSNFIDVWNARSLKLEKVISAQGEFDEGGSAEFPNGYMRVSNDGRLLFVKIQDGVLVVPVR